MISQYIENLSREKKKENEKLLRDYEMRKSEFRNYNFESKSFNKVKVSRALTTANFCFLLLCFGLRL